MAYPREEHTQLLAKFGHMITVWNELEQRLRSVLMYALEAECPPSAAAQILTAHMKNTALCAALKTAATEFKSGELQTSMLHAVKGIERLREYRNYYGHGFTQVGWGHAGPIGYLETDSANVRLTRHDRIFGLDEIEKLTEQMEQFRDFTGQIYAFMRDGDKPHWSELHASWPQMPPLPDILVKPRRYPLDAPPPPPASAE